MIAAEALNESPFTKHSIKDGHLSGICDIEIGVFVNELKFL